MQLGIFAKTFDRPNVASCLQAVADAGIPATQFNLSVAGLPTIPTSPYRMTSWMPFGRRRPGRHLPRSPAPSTPPTPTRHTGRPTWPVPAPVRSRPRPADRHITLSSGSAIRRTCGAGTPTTPPRRLG